MLTCIFLSLVLAVGSVGEAASRRGAVSAAECIVETAGRSVLAGYDRGLKERYSLFGYEYDEARIEEMIKTLSQESLESFSLTGSEISEVSAEKAGYCLADPEVFCGQISDLMKDEILDGAADDFFGMFQSAKQAVNLLSAKEEQKNALEEAKEEARRAQEERQAEAESESDDEEGIDFSTADSVHNMLKNLRKDAEDDVESVSGTPSLQSEKRILRNGKVTDVLPSVQAGCRHNTAFSGFLSALSEFSEFAGIDEVQREIYVDGYILNFFSEHTKERSEQSFFQNEVEYILYGNFSDEENYKNARRAVFTVRLALNMAYLYSSPEMIEQTLALAESLTPGPFASLTQALIIMAWSSLEALNDVKNLEAGNGIPLMKSADTWKITLSTVASGQFTGGMIENDSPNGMKYSSYLRILLLTEKTETKLYRIMDLIQINMKGSNRGDFVLGNLFTGFVAEMELTKKSIYAGIPTGRTSLRIAHTY